MGAQSRPTPGGIPVADERLAVRPTVEHAREKGVSTPCNTFKSW